MKLIVLLVVLAMRRMDINWPAALIRPQRIREGLAVWWDRLETMPELARWSLAVLIPSVLVALVFSLLEHWLWGVPAWFVGGLLLLWLLGGESEFRSVDDLLVRGRMKDEKLFADAAQEYFQVSAGAGDKSFFTELERRILMQDARQLFATVFWLIILGYWAAFLYVVNLAYVQTLEKSEGSLAEAIHGFLFWPPTRLLVLCLALAADFRRVTAAVHGRVWQLGDNETLLQDAVAAALARDEGQESDEMERNLDRLEALQSTLLRCLALWLVMAAVWVMLVG